MAISISLPRKRRYFGEESWRTSLLFIKLLVLDKTELTRFIFPCTASGVSIKLHTQNLGKILYILLINVCFFLRVPGNFWNFCCFITFAGLCAINHGVYTVFHNLLVVSSQTPLQTDLFLILLNLLPTCLNIPSALIFISASPHFIFIQILQPI